MITLFCSERLAKLIGAAESGAEAGVESKLGSWNGHVFIIDRKRNLIFTNDKTAYSFVLINIKKAALKDFNNLFKEALIRQLYNDLAISEKQEIKIRRWLGDIRLVKTESKKIKISIKDFIKLIKQEALQKGGVSYLHNVAIAYGLNNHFIGTKRKPGERKFSIPKELMENLIK